MADENNPEFDPRFDRAFQRGFEGEVTTRAPQPTGYLPTNPVRSNLPPTATQPGYAQPGYAQPAYPQASASRNAGAESLGLGAAPQLSAVPELETDDEPVATEVEYATGRNPFLIGLTVISVVLVVGGLAGLQWLRGRFLSPDIATELDFVTVQAATVGAVIVVGLGLATAIGVLFVSAARWRGRRV